jgi:hypothetical protein
VAEARERKRHAVGARPELFDPVPAVGVRDGGPRLLDQRRLRASTVTGARRRLRRSPARQSHSGPG